MKYFIDTHDKTKGSPTHVLTEDQFLSNSTHSTRRRCSLARSATPHT